MARQNRPQIMQQYGVRQRNDPRDTVVVAPSWKIAVDMLNPDDVLMVKEGSCPHTNQCMCPGGWQEADQP